MTFVEQTIELTRVEDEAVDGGGGHAEDNDADGDEDVDDWPNVLDGIEITQEKLDAAVEKMRPVSLMFVCMFAPEECKEDQPKE